MTTMCLALLWFATLGLSYRLGEAIEHDQYEAEIERLREALSEIVERCLDSGFPDEWISDDSSMAMQVTMGGRELAAARAALAVAGGIA